MATIQYLHNTALPIILDNWKGNPHNGSRFYDPNKRFENKFFKAIKWQTQYSEKRAQKKHDTYKTEVIKNKDFLHTAKNQIVWLGHASFYIQLGEIKIITDPVFGNISGVVKRHASLPCEIDDIKNINYILLSHGHRDHCDKKSLSKLSKNNPDVTLLTSLGLGKFVKNWLPKINYTEAGWYQQYILPEIDLKITYLPAQHWSNRMLWDINKTLWGSFVIQYRDITVFFGGDSGYSKYTKQIASLFPSIDFALLGVGAYTPSFIMQDVHTSPEEALTIATEMNVKNFIPMHYGTFDLADEPMGEPYRHLATAKAENKNPFTIHLPAIGESVWL